MEYRDRMHRLRKRKLGSIILFFCLLILWIVATNNNKNNYYSIYVLSIVVGSVGIFFLFILMVFERYRPDFIISDKYIGFANIGIIYLIGKKENNYIVPFTSIIEIIDLDDRMGFEITSKIKHVTIHADQFDDYQIIRDNILNIAKRYGIKIIS